MENESFIRDNFLPIFLGNTRSARRLARELYKKYGVVAYICDKRAPLFSELILEYTFFRVSGAALGELLSDELLYLTSLDPACVYTAMAFTDEYAHFLDEYADKLEGSMIIQDRVNIYSKFPFTNNEIGG